MKKLFSELKRRKVFQFSAIYAVAAWIIVQISVAAFPALLLPDWSVRFVIIIALIGFPFVVILAWAHESTPASPESVSQMSEVDVDAPLPERPTLAVLPFSNISSDPEQEHLADSLTEDLITDLSKHGSLQIIARNSTFIYKGQAVDVRQAGKDLGADLILEGSLRKAKDMVRFTAQLIDTRNGHHLWADRQDREITNELEVQDLICNDIASGVVGILFQDAAQEERALPAPASTSGFTFLSSSHELETNYTQVDGLNIAYNESGSLRLLRKAAAL